MSEQLVKIIGITSDEDGRKRLEEIADWPDITCMTVLEPASSLVDKATAYPVDAVVLYTDGFSVREEEFISDFNATRKGVAGILVVEQEIDIDIFERAMGCGISKVIQASEATGEICSTIVAEVEKYRSRADTAQVRRYDSKVIAFYSSKGGSGKSTSSINIATALAQAGKKVTILDLDITYGDIEASIKIAKGRNLGELALQATTEKDGIPTPSIIKQYVRKAVDIPGLSVICAPTNPEYEQYVKPETVSKIIDTLRLENDYVVLDLYQQMDNITATALEECDCLYYIVNPELPMLKQTKICKDTILAPAKILEKTRLVVNKDGESTITADDVEDFLKMDVFASIPFDTQTVVSSTNAGIPLMAEQAGSKGKGGLFGSLRKKPIVKAYESMTAQILAMR